MDIRKYINNNILILDGGLGTMLQGMGLAKGELSEEWSLKHSNKVYSVHKAYFDAGSNVVSTNTFGVNSLKYSLDEMETLISAAVELCKEARDNSESKQEKFIAFDIGPLGQLLKPYGTLSFEDAVSVFSDAVKIAVKYGVDLFMIETFTDIYETKAALLAVKENSDLPVFVSNAYGEDGKLLTGASPEVMAALLSSMGADAIGLNCSFGPEQALPIIDRMVKSTNIPIILKPNAGLPIYNNGNTEYDISPEKFASIIESALDIGVSIIGGCCGTTPEHIAKISHLSQKKAVKRCADKRTVVTSSTRTIEFGEKPILIGERINPTGKKRFKQALLENDIDYIVNEGINQQNCGVHILDVNVGLAGIDEREVLKNTVLALQSVSDLPLQIDTSDVSALECALRIYNGKPLINSVNGKISSLNSVFPLMKKYGGAVIALTLDENGIPDSFEGRMQIVEKILSTAKEYGIQKEDIIFDPLTMAVSTDKNSAVLTLKCIKEITERYGCKTCLGVSNISFGMPCREKLNSSFFLLAMSNGLSAAIMNPFSSEMLSAYYSFCALNNKDDNFFDYLSFCDTADVTKTITFETNKNDLQDAICKGRKDAASIITGKLLSEMTSLDIIDKYIIPALNVTGEHYESGKIYLPQLLSSAEAASSAFDVIKNNSAIGTDIQNRCKIVLATVEGDVHDIGKNIVRMLLENYGFEVIDLGKDVPAENIVATIIENDVHLVGLSALMTTTLESMKNTVSEIKKRCKDCYVFVGGAVVTQDFADSISADAYTKDAMASVRFAEEISEKIELC